MERLSKESSPKKLTEHIVNTLFGYILRKEDIQTYESQLGQVIPDVNISQRYLIAYLLQSADFGLRSRLNHYLCMNASVPLIMNCQKTFRSQTDRMIFN